MFSNLKNKYSDWRGKIRNYNKITNVSADARRYFVINGFDGIITILGVIVGNYVVKVTDYKHVILISFAMCISLGVSGIWGAYFFESAERQKNLEELENSTLHNLDHTVIYYANRFASRISGAVNGIAPVITALIPVIPFFFGKVIDIRICYYISFGIALVSLFGVGIFLGKTTRTRLLIGGIKMLLAGVFCVALSLILNFIS
jgi:predicted membrane protein (TIGR00267 family)